MNQGFEYEVTCPCGAELKITGSQAGSKGKTARVFIRSHRNHRQRSNPYDGFWNTFTSETIKETKPWKSNKVEESSQEQELRSGSVAPPASR